MDSAALALFVQAATSDSLAAAARRLRISPLTASRRLSALEADLGVRLIHRTTRASHLTADGEVFLPHAQAILETEALARESVLPTARGVSGLLRVTASAAFGRQILAPIVARFMDDNPEVRVDLLLTDTLVDLVAEGVDLAIRIANPQDSGLVGRRVGDSARGLYATPAYVAARPAPQTLADLAGHQCLALTGVRHWPFVSGGGLKAVAVAGRFTTNAIEGAHAGCLAGLGIALLSAWAVREDVSEGRLVRLDLTDAEPQPLAVWALYPTRRLAPAKVTAFINALERGLTS